MTTDHHDYLPQAPDELAARHRLELVTRMVRKVFHAAGETNPPLELVAIRAEKAVKLWKWIPGDRLEWAVNRARAEHGGPGLTIEKVADAWLHRNRKIKVSDTERERRRLLAEERADREKAAPEFVQDFFRSIETTLKEMK
jgi:hypothetical protein